MRNLSYTQCFHVLDLPESASPEHITAAFRRLAKQHHPDVNQTPEGRRRFVEIVRAYGILRQRLQARRAHADFGRCVRCGAYAALLKPLGEGMACAQCLLGETLRRRYLPLPLITVARHAGVFLLYAAALLSLMRYFSTGRVADAAVSLMCIAAGLLLLASEVVAIAWSQRIRPARRRTAPAPDLHTQSCTPDAT